MVGATLAVALPAHHRPGEMANLTQFTGDNLFSLDESCILAGIPMDFLWLCLEELRHEDHL